MDRQLSDIVREGQEKTLEAMALAKKELAGTLTPDESRRLAMLNGNLLALAEQAQAMGFGVAVGQGLPIDEVDEVDEGLLEGDEDCEYSTDEVGGICYCGDPDCR